MGHQQTEQQARRPLAPLQKGQAQQRQRGQQQQVGLTQGKAEPCREEQQADSQPEEQPPRPGPEASGRVKLPQRAF